MGRETNSRTDFSSSGELPSDSDRQGVSAHPLAWYIQHLDGIEWTDHQSSAPDNMPAVNSILSDGQPSMILTANDPQSNPYTSTYLRTGSPIVPSSHLVVFTSPTSYLFFPMNEPDRVSSPTTAKYVPEDPHIIFHLSPEETGKNDNVTLTFLVPPFWVRVRGERGYIKAF
ncbi:hypothetical protein I315_06782 [Cryptococcus gattii Ru294]|nr:hypothetical protein I315_06782 [Cryptococcus gattii Ru294]